MPTRIPKAKSELEETLAIHIRTAIPNAPKREYQFCEGRQYRFDFAWPDEFLAVEVQGAIWRKGAHSSGVGITRDCEKICAAAILGWRVMPVTGDQIKSGAAISWIQQALHATAR